eukprot:7170832-Ditylum_brightwellii.AAC.1
MRVTNKGSNNNLEENNKEGKDVYNGTLMAAYTAMQKAMEKELEEDKKIRKMTGKKQITKITQTHQCYICKCSIINN